MTDIAIRKLTTHAEFLACEAIQLAAWDTTERDVVPAHLFHPLQKYGGIVLGAFAPDGDMVGFVYGFIGRIEDERATWMKTPYLYYSEMMGVLPAYRGRSVGYRLKLAQRERALEEGYKLIVWTYDPLLSLNAWLNIKKLGGICRHYIRDAYGELGGIYAGLSTDRFEVEWWIASQHAKMRLSEHTPYPGLAAWLEAGADLINPASLSRKGLPVPCDRLPSFTATQLLVEIPANLQEIKQADMKLAHEWRMHTRAIFEQAFAAGYVVAWFVTGQDKRSYYVLTNNMNVPALAGGEDAG